MCNGKYKLWGDERHPSAKNVMDALGRKRITSDYRHSDRKHQVSLLIVLRKKGIFILVNSVMENFFGLLKQEIYYGVVYYSYDRLK